MLDEPQETFLVSSETDPYRNPARVWYDLGRCDDAPTISGSFFFPIMILVCKHLLSSQASPTIPPTFFAANSCPDPRKPFVVALAVREMIESP